MKKKRNKKNKLDSKKDIENKKSNQNINDDLISAAQKAAPDVPQEKVVKIVQTTIQHQGPLPHPAILSGYNSVIKNGAERLFSLFERQSTHRMEYENFIARHDIIQSYIGMFFAFIITLTVVIIGGILIYNDKQLAGYGTLLTGIAGIITSFIGGRYLINKAVISKQKEIVNKK
jgi:uncharacterized membrane protein